jgi:hypothetical protein
MPCCLLAHSETPSSSKKELHKSHSRDDEQPPLTQNLCPRLFIHRTPAPSTNLPRAAHPHWPQSPLNDSLDSAPKPALPFTPAPRTTRCNTTLDVTTAPSNSSLESTDTADSPVRSITSPWIDSSSLSSRYPKFFESVHFQWRTTLRPSAWFPFRRLHRNTSTPPNFQESEQATESLCLANARRLSLT